MFSLLVLLSGAVMTDFWDYRIPNSLIVLGLLTGISYRISKDGFYGIVISMVGMAVPMILLFPVFYIRGIGAGDIKLLAVTGSYLGLSDNMKCMALAFMIGAVLSLGKLLWNGNLKKRIRYMGSYLCYCLCFRQKKERLLPAYRDETDSKSVIHFSLPIALGTFLLIGGIWN